MKSKLRKSWILALSVSILLGACGSLAFPAKGQAGTNELAKGAELWANNCRRCHNYRSPATLTDAQWDVAVLHMRVRANLTGEEHRSILAFLQSGN